MIASMAYGLGSSSYQKTSVYPKNSRQDVSEFRGVSSPAEVFNFIKNIKAPGIYASNDKVPQTLYNGFGLAWKPKSFKLKTPPKKLALRIEGIKMQIRICSALLVIIALMGCGAGKKDTAEETPSDQTPQEGLFFRGDNGISGQEVFFSDGQKIQLVRDLNTTPNDSRVFNGDLSINEKVRMGNFNYFVAWDRIHGAELWKTDGTAAGTRLVKDTIPGPVDGNPVRLTVVKTGSKETLFFYARKNLTDINGNIDFPAHRALWKSDGTTEGTVEIGGDWMAEPSATLLPIQRAGNAIFALGGDYAYGFELWYVDTTQPTLKAVHLRRVMEMATLGDSAVFTVRENLNPFFDYICPLYSFSATRGSAIKLESEVSCSGLQSYKSNVYYSKFTTTLGKEIWRTDGVSTNNFTDLYPDSNSSNPNFIGIVNNLMIFSAQNGDGPQVFATDGVTVYSLLVANPIPSYTIYPVVHISENYLYFLASTSTGTHLYRTDGKKDFGAVRLKSNFNRMQTAYNSPLVETLITEWNNLIYFVDNAKLYSSDGSADSAQLVAFHHDGADIELSTYGVQTVFGSEFVFVGYDSQYAWSIWATDSSGNLKRLASVAPPQTSLNSPVHPLIMQGDKNIQFYGWDAVAGNELWQYDGSTASRLMDINPSTKDMWIDSLVSAGNQSIFATDQYSTLWRATGSPLAAEKLSLVPADGDPKPYTYTALSRHGKNVYVVSIDTKRVQTLWMIDPYGKPSAVFDTTLFPGTNRYLLTIADITDNFILLRTTEPVNDTSSDILKIWRFNRATKKLSVVYESRPPSAEFPQVSFLDSARVGTQVYFSTSVLYHKDIWVVKDASEIAEKMVSNIDSNGYLTNTDTAIYYTIQNQNRGLALWTLGKDALSPALIKEISDGTSPEYLYSLRSDGNSLMFISDDPQQDFALWKTDGTEMGTQIVERCTFRVRSSAKIKTCIAPLRSYNGHHYFWKTDDENRWRLWRTENSTENRQFLDSDLNFGEIDLEILGNQMYFVADDGIHGNELWRSDGTIEGTSLVQDLFPGSGSGLNSYWKVGSHL